VPRPARELPWRSCTGSTSSGRSHSYAHHRGRARRCGRGWRSPWTATPRAGT
jgi:hypothetical protein